MKSGGGKKKHEKSQASLRVANNQVHLKEGFMSGQDNGYILPDSLESLSKEAYSLQSS